MNNIVSEIQFIPVKPSNGLIGFCSFVLYESFYCSSIAIFARPEGGYRLVYPKKNLGEKQIDIFHPIHKEAGDKVEKSVLKKINEILYPNNDRYNNIIA